MRNILFFLFTSLLSTGCVTNIGFLGMASTQPEIASNVKYKRLGSCKATDKVLILFVPWGISRIETALKSCMDKYPNAAYVSNASVGVYQNNWIFFAWVGYQVEGTVYGRADSSNITSPDEHQREQTYFLKKTDKGLAMVSATELIPVQPIKK